MEAAKMMRRVGVGVLVIASLLLAPIVTSAQSISGTVTDATGNILPGVTVEARSPALIEQVRTAVTNGSGQYQIIELRPGTYSVSFALTGFSTLVREGIELTSGFTANVDVQLRVGALEETVIVTGATPLVDVQNGTRHTVATREIIDTIPAWQGSNFDDRLRALGVNATNRVKEQWNAEVKVGGPIVRNKLWFFATHGRFKADEYVLGLYYSQDPRAIRQVPDLNRQAVSEQNGYTTIGRLTWQATPRNKLTGYVTEGSQYYPTWLL